MKTVIPLIRTRQEQYRRHPFIEFLKDRRVASETRLSYAPFAAFFSMSFFEFNKYHITVPEPRSEAEKALNEHAREDESHYKWFLQDLETLGFNPSCRFTDALAFIWSEEGQRARELSHFLIGVTQRASAEEKLVILEAIEATGAVWLDATVQAVSQHPEAGRLTYFNETHEGRELDFIESGGHSAIASVELSQAVRAAAPTIVDGIFDRMEAFNSELLARLNAVKPGCDFMGRPLRSHSELVSHGGAARQHSG